MIRPAPLPTALHMQLLTRSAALVEYAADAARQIATDGKIDDYTEGKLVIAFFDLMGENVCETLEPLAEHSREIDAEADREDARELAGYPVVRRLSPVRL